MKLQKSPEPRRFGAIAAGIALALTVPLAAPLAGCSICSDYEIISVVTIDRTLPMAKSQAATLTYQLCVDRCVVVEPGDGARFYGKVTLTEDGPNATKVHAELDIDERESTARVTFRASEGSVIRLEVVGNVPFTDVENCHTKATVSEL
jgi:hypothetical protein